MFSFAFLNQKKDSLKKLSAERIESLTDFLTAGDLVHFNATNKDIHQLTMPRLQVFKEARRKLDGLIPGVSHYLDDYHTAQLIVDDFPGIINFFRPGPHSIHDPWWKDKQGYFFAYIQSPEILNQIKNGSLTPEIISARREDRDLTPLLKSYGYMSRDRLAILGLSREEHIKLFWWFGHFSIKRFLLDATNPLLESLQSEYAGMSLYAQLAAYYDDGTPSMPPLPDALVISVVDNSPTGTPTHIVFHPIPRIGSCFRDIPAGTIARTPDSSSISASVLIRPEARVASVIRPFTIPTPASTNPSCIIM